MKVWFKNFFWHFMNDANHTSAMCFFGMVVFFILGSIIF